MTFTMEYDRHCEGGYGIWGLANMQPGIYLGLRGSDAQMGNCKGKGCGHCVLGKTQLIFEVKEKLCL